MTSSSISFYFRHSTTPWIEKLRFALRETWFTRGQVSPLWTLLTQARLPVSPQLVCKTMEAPQRLFYDWRYGYAERVQALCEHYDFVLHRLPTRVAAPILMLQCCVLFTYAGKSGVPYQLRLRVDHQMEKEGSLTLELVCQDHPLIRCTWHLARLVSGNEAANAWVIRIGSLQSTNVDTQQQLRQATKDFHGIQPRILILQALRCIAQALGVARIEAVGGAWHVYSSSRYRKPIASDYDQLWTFLGLAPMPDGHFVADTQISLKDLEDVPSHKRSEYRRRNECLQQMQEEIAKVLRT